MLISKPALAKLRVRYSQSLLQPAAVSASDQFGSLMDISGDGNTLIVGAVGTDGNNVSNATFSGAAYVYTVVGGVFTETQKLTPSDASTQSSQYFGTSVSISGDGSVIVVGTKNSNRVYVFTNSGGTWTETAILTPSDTTANISFACSLSISHDGKRLVVGALTANRNAVTNSGAAYVYTESGGVWTEVQILTPNTQKEIGYFGNFICLTTDGNTLIVGSRGYGILDKFNSDGAAYVFSWDGSAFVQDQLILSPDGNIGDKFGQGITISPDNSTLLISSPNHDTPESNAGAVYVYRLVSDTWTFQDKLTHIDLNIGDSLGSIQLERSSMVSNLDGTILIVGAGLSSYLFVFSETSPSTWTYYDIIVPFDGETSTRFGSTICATPDISRILVAAEFHPETAATAGVVYSLVPG